MMIHSRTVKSDRDAPDGLDALFVTGFLLAAVVYTLMFNLLEDGLRTNIAGALGILALARCIASWPRPASAASTFLLLGFLTVLVFYFVFCMDARQQDGAIYATLVVRAGTCLAIMMVFTHGPRTVSPSLLAISIVIIGIAAAFVAATGAPTMLGETLRPATFTGGKEGVHSTGYVLAAALLGSITLWRCGWLSLPRLLILATPLVALILMFQVRTTWTMIAVYVIATGIVELRSRDRRGGWLAVMIFLAAVGLLAYVAGLSVDYAEFSSGRTDAYAERIEMILNRQLPELMFGTGAGSEMLTNSVWWWAAKNSHNDFIDFTIQAGVVGLAMVVAMLLIAASRLDRLQWPLFAAFVSSSMISNGLLGRPFIAVLLLASMLIPVRQGDREEFSAFPYGLRTQEA